MAITLGTNGYISVDDFKAWADQRGYEYLDWIDSEIEAAITISGVDFLDINYNFKGDSVSDTQPMQLPTSQVTIADIENGAAQAVWQQLNGLLFVTQTASSANGEVIKQRDKLDVLETEVEYAEGTSSSYKFNTTTIDRLLAKYTTFGGGAPQLVRV